jgi:peptide/nickel transport system substrate-binding protein
VLDEAHTVANDHYVFNPNPAYWDKSSQHWRKVVVRVITDQSSAVRAIQAGQVDYTGGAVNLLRDIQAAGLPFSTAPAGVIGIVLADRAGTVVPQLKDQRVRQALNYAIDRNAILQALYAGYGSTTSQPASPGYDGFDPGSNDHYGYDPAKARQLMSDAGFANGFTVNMLTSPFIGQENMAQAVSEQWKAIGVIVNLTSISQAPTFFEEALSHKYTALTFGILGGPASLASTTLMLPIPNPQNPFATGDDQMASLLQQAAALPDSTRGETNRKAMARLVDLAWFAPVVQVDGVVVGSPRISGFQVTKEAPFTDVLRIEPA